MKIETSPLISVVIPTYNHADFLEIAIKSVLEQTYQNFEVVIIDNHSKDHTDEVVDSFNDDRISISKINNNGVIGASRNLGVEQTKGSWIAYLDSDDYWYPTRLNKVARYLECFTATDVISTDEYKINKLTGDQGALVYGPLGGAKYKSLLLYGNRLSTSATIVRKQFLVENDIRFNENLEFATVEDYDYWLQLANANASFKFIHSFEGEYLLHGANSSGYADLHNRNELNLLKHHVFNVQNFENNKENLWRTTVKTIAFREALVSLRIRFTWSAVFTLVDAVSWSPLHIGRWVCCRLLIFITRRFHSIKSSFNA